MSICRDCVSSPTKVCAHHHLGANNLSDSHFDAIVMLRRARIALADKHDPGHPALCGTCGGLITDIDLFLERESGGTT